MITRTRLSVTSYVHLHSYPFYRITLVKLYATIRVICTNLQLISSLIFMLNSNILPIYKLSYFLDQISTPINNVSLIIYVFLRFSLRHASRFRKEFCGVKSGDSGGQNIVFPITRIFRLDKNCIKYILLINPELPNHLGWITSSVTSLNIVTGNVSVQVMHHHLTIKQINNYCIAGCIHNNIPIAELLILDN